MKVIFLDIDGVLNSVETMKLHGLDKMWNDNPDPKHIHWLNHIIEQTGAVVVISSTWRSSASSTSMWRLLALLGFKGQVIGNTPKLDSYRGTEIKTWINEHNDKIEKYKESTWYPYKEKVDSFVILDDDSDMGDLKPFLVQTKSEFGLCESHALKAIKILNERIQDGAL